MKWYSPRLLCTFFSGSIQDPYATRKSRAQTSNNWDPVLYTFPHSPSPDRKAVSFSCFCYEEAEHAEWQGYDGIGSYLQSSDQAVWQRETQTSVMRRCERAETRRWGRTSHSIFLLGLFSLHAGGSCRGSFVLKVTHYCQDFTVFWYKRNLKVQIGILGKMLGIIWHDPYLADLLLDSSP